MDNIFSAGRDSDQGEDRISELPDDILLSIMMMTRMGMKEAAKTSILSKRWRYFWAMQTHLDFNHLVLFPGSNPTPILVGLSSDQKTKYINWINQVVDLHCSPCIDTFKVHFQFEKNVAHHVDKWVRFATSKKVKHLELNLCSLYGSVLYTIEFDILKPSLSPGHGDISSLISLHLNNINISGVALEFLLSRCHLLERLHIAASWTLDRLKLNGLSCKLKQLTIKLCPSLVELEIDAPNLVSFDYDCANHDSSLVFKSVPMLVEVAVGGVNIKSTMSQVFRLAGQFSKLSLTLGKSAIPCAFRPTLSLLKQLNLVVLGCADVDVDAIMTLLESCPMVREFKLEFIWFFDELVMESYMLEDVNLEDDDVEVDDLEEVENVLDLEDTNTMVHPNLKVLHICGFSGGYSDVKIILDVVDFACNLETIICDPARYYYYYDFDDENASDYRSRASKIAKIVPPKIRVEIIQIPAISNCTRLL